MMTMVGAVALAVAGVSANSATLQEQSHTDTLAERLWFSSNIASGQGLCDRGLARWQSARFQKRYGKRIAALKKRYYAHRPPDPDPIYVSVCRRTRDKAYLNDELNKFADVLTSIETNYR